MHLDHTDRDQAVAGALFALATSHPSIASVVRAQARPTISADCATWVTQAPTGPSSARRFALHLLVLGMLLVLYACGPGEPPRAVSVGEICQQDAGALVVAEGQLRLPMSFLLCGDGRCRIELHDSASSVMIELPVSTRGNSGALVMPPEPYSDDDLVFILGNGTRVDRSTPLQITGRVHKQGSTCFLKAQNTEPAS